MPICQCIKKDGNRCTYKAKPGKLFCGVHKNCKKSIDSTDSSRPDRPVAVPVDPDRPDRPVRPVAIAKPDGPSGPSGPSKLISKKECKEWLRTPHINPKTGRLIKIGSSTFRKYVKACATHGVKIPEPKGQFTEMYQCHTDSDGITAEQFEDMTDEELSTVIRLGSGNCYKAESLFGWYKANQEKGKQTTDPMNPSYILTKRDIGLIEAYMKGQDPKYIRPGKKDYADPPRGYSLEVEQDWYTAEGIHTLMLHAPDGSMRSIGSLPMRHDQDEDEVNSYAVYLLILELWNRGQLTIDNDPARPTGFSLLDDTTHDHSLWYDRLPVPIGHHDTNSNYPQPYNSHAAIDAMTRNLLTLQGQLE